MSVKTKKRLLIEGVFLVKSDASVSLVPDLQRIVSLRQTCTGFRF